MAHRQTQRHRPAAVKSGQKDPPRLDVELPPGQLDAVEDPLLRLLRCGRPFAAIRSIRAADRSASARRMPRGATAT